MQKHWARDVKVTVSHLKCEFCGFESHRAYQISSAGLSPVGAPYMEVGRKGGLANKGQKRAPLSEERKEHLREIWRKKKSGSLV